MRCIGPPPTVSNVQHVDARHAARIVLPAPRTKLPARYPASGRERKGRPRPDPQQRPRHQCTARKPRRRMAP